MDERWYMLLDEDNGWSWAVFKDETITRRASSSFERYFDAYEDAKKHGCLGVPCIHHIDRVIERTSPIQ